MEYVFVGEDRVPCDAVQEGLEHALPLRDHGHILLCLRLPDCIVTNALLRRDWGDDEGWVELGETCAEGFKLGVATTRF